MNILVTGGAGYVGAHCAKALHEAGHKSVVLDNFSTGHREFVRWGPLIEGDVRDGGFLDRLLVAERFDAVMHFAAHALVAESVTNPGLYYDVNIHGTNVLLSAMVRAGIQSIVFSSSCAVYGEPEDLPITESTVKAPVNPYGMTKFVCERMMDDFGASHGLRSVRLRYFNAAGADPGGMIGEDHSPETHAIPSAIMAAMGLRSEFVVFGTDYVTEDGSAVRDYIHVSDLAAAHIKALEYLLEGGPTVAANLGTGKGSSVREIIAAVNHVSGREVPVRFAGRRQGDPATLVADPALARKLFGWTPTRSGLNTIVGDAWHWHNRGSF